MPNLRLRREAIHPKVQDAIILDRNLPDGDGLDLLREMRDSGNPTPVIALIAHDMPSDRIGGRNDGADEYLGSPFLAEELIARMER